MQQSESLCPDFVAEVFCPSECVRLIQDQASMRNVDSRIHSLRFDCCVFLFYSFSAVTFATKSPQCGREETRARNVAARMRRGRSRGRLPAIRSVFRTP